MAVRQRRVIAPMRCTLYLLLAVCLWPLAAPHAREISAIKADLDTKRAAYNAQLGRANAVKERYIGVEGALEVSEKAAGARKTEMEEALAKYRKVQQLAIEHPEISPEKDRRAYAKAKGAYEKAQGLARRRRQTLATAQSNLRNEEGKLRGIATEIETLETEMEGERIARLRKQLEREQTVEVRGEASCGNNTIAQCKKLAMAEARRLAVEQASAVIVDSASEVEKFELTKDQIRMQVRGIIKSQQELESGFVGDSGYYYRIRAVVLGQLPEDCGKKRAMRGDAATDTGNTWREPATGMEFVPIPGGTYEQGCGPWTSDCDDNEKPTRRVTLSPFWLGRTEVTRGQFAKFVHDAGYTTDAEKDGGCWVWTGKWEKKAGTSFRDPGFSQDDAHPVACVSWNDAQAFAAWLSRESGQRFRLPSEAEWEYACRAGGKPIKYAWDSGAPDSGASKAANIADEAAKRQFSAWTIWNGYDDGYVYTAPVGSFAANGLALHDMTGNVWEWTQDVYGDTAYTGGSTSDPIHAGSGDNRVGRGGGWSSDPHAVRCSNRFRSDPAGRDGYLGFRLARTN